MLIVGGGPSGLFCACELRRRGLPVRIIERAAAPHRQARATVLQAATRELLHRCGLQETFEAAAMLLRRGLLLDPAGTPLGQVHFEAVDSPFPGQLSLPQWRTEELLGQQLERLGGRLERGCTLRQVELMGDGLQVRLSHDSGTVESLWVRYLIDASGSHSLTRASMQEELEGSTYPGLFLVADALLADPPALSRDDCSLVQISPQGMALLAPLPEGRTLLFLGGLDPADPTAPDDLDTLAALLRQRCGSDFGVHDIRWASEFHTHKRLAPRLGDGRRFLLGDAGHLSSPLGGEGMNAGLMDAADLAWKLGLVLNGQAPASLLDSYAQERALVDRQVLACSDGLHQLVETLVATAAAGSQPTLPAPDPASEQRQLRARAMLDHSLAGTALVGEHWALALDAPQPPAPQPGERWPDRCSLACDLPLLLVWGEPEPALPPWIERWHGRLACSTFQQHGLDPRRAGLPAEHGPAAVLIRPDGFIGFRCAPLDRRGVEALDAYLRQWLLPAEAASAA